MAQSSYSYSMQSDISKGKKNANIFYIKMPTDYIKHEFLCIGLE